MSDTMSGTKCDTRMATLNFRDDDPGNPIMSIVFAHSSLVGDTYTNPNPAVAEPVTLFKWTKNHPGPFTAVDHGYLSAHDEFMINECQQDIWAVAFQRRYNRYVEYFEQTEGFWKKLGEDVVIDICNSAIDAADLFDDETTTLPLDVATDLAINEMFTKGDGDVIMKNWVHWKSFKISFKVGKDKGHIHSTDHDTSCKTERLGKQDNKQ
jgi:hypothetical protein